MRNGLSLAGVAAPARKFVFVKAPETPNAHPGKAADAKQAKAAGGSNRSCGGADSVTSKRRVNLSKTLFKLCWKNLEVNSRRREFRLRKSQYFLMKGKHRLGDAGGHDGKRTQKQRHADNSLQTH